VALRFIGNPFLLSIYTISSSNLDSTDYISMSTSSMYYPHLAQSLAILVEAQQWEAAAHLAMVLGEYWEGNEQLREGIRWATMLVATTPPGGLPSSLHSRLHLLLGNLYRHLGEYPTATTHYDHALPTATTFSDPRHDTAVISGLGEIAFRRGQYDDATSHYQAYLKLGEQAQDPALIADGLNALGRIAAARLHHAEAMDYHHEGQALAEQATYPLGVAWSLNAQGEIARSQGRYAHARHLFQATRDLFQQLGNPARAMLATQNLAFVLLHEGNLNDAERLLKSALRFWQQGPSRHAIALSLIGLAHIDSARQHFPTAAQRLALAEALLKQIGVVLELGDGQECAEAMDTVQRRLGQEVFWRIATTLHSHPLASLLADPIPPVGQEKEYENAPPSSFLSPREVELLTLVAQGLSDKQIATNLTISPHTVNAHLRTIYRKLGVTNRTAAVAAARAKYLI
jgi:DNA-binding CsgD family transcriptional regulator/tetratricopeptide (TPR) repeat protein